VNPHPRDYRQGIFKFTSSAQPRGQRKPLRADLLRTLREGIEGTSMPSFGLLDEDDLNSLVSYVIHLSLRGQVEYWVMKDLLTPDAEVGDIRQAVREKLANFTSLWVQAKRSRIRPGPYPYVVDGKEIHPANDEDGFLRESVQNGQKVFKAADCATCHKDYGRQASYMYDDWGTIVRPANLTAGVYRGGRRPIDLYYRLYGGIDGSGMAELAGKPGKPPAKPDKSASPEALAKYEQQMKAYEADVKRIWDLVNFLQVLPYLKYPEMQRKYGIILDNPDR
jgi:hypothetical protein